MLVAAPADGTDVVLQMPRGNLETVAPRALVLAAIVAALGAADGGAGQADWALAWQMAVDHRVDLNLLVDLRWPTFLSQAAAFVGAVPVCISAMSVQKLMGTVLAHAQSG